MRAALWHAAEILRDRMDAAQVRDLVLTLVAVRHLVDDARWQALATEGLPAAIRQIRAERPDLSDGFPPVLPDLRSHRVDELLAALDAVPDQAEGDALGDAYMHLLGEFARAEGRRGGQYYTPPSVTRLAVRLVEPIEGVVYDPCCGSGGLLVEAATRAEAGTRCVGQELNPRSRRLARLNSAVHDLDLDLGSSAADTLADDRHPHLRADRIIANPPFNLARWAGDDSDPRWRFGTPPRGNANMAWVQHIVHHLAPDGSAAVILANGSLTARGPERAIRAALVRAGMVEAVVALPDLLFLTTPIPASIWVLGRPRRPAPAVCFVDARQLGHRPHPSLRVLEASDIDRIVSAVRDARAGRHVAEPGFAAVAPRDEVAARGDLAPGTWVSAAAVGPSTEDLGSLIARARGELDKAERLDARLRAALDALDRR